MKYNILISSILAVFMMGCSDEKIEHFKNGGTLKCIDKGGIFSDDKTVYVNDQNWNYGTSYTHANFGAGKFSKKDGFFNSSIDADDCSIN
jgi:hypothetical protein